LATARGSPELGLTRRGSTGVARIVPSRSRRKWLTERAEALDEIEAAHRAVGGRRRRHAAQQVNQAYTLLLSSHFQGLCRDLYCEAADHLVAQLAPPAPLWWVVREQFTVGLKLNHGNPTPGNLGADFGRLGFKLWHELALQDARSAGRKLRLKALCDWRNAIAHHDFDPGKLDERTRVRLADVRSWRSACTALAASLDAVVRDQLHALVGVAPW